MENIEDSVKETSKDAMGFFKYVFKMDGDEKGTILNILQYTLLALIPILLVLKLIRTYVSDSDEDKGSLIILAEILGQIFTMFLSIYLIHRMIIYIPTFSGIKYADFNLTNLILGFLMIILTLQTKLGDKVQILIERVQNLWDGSTNLKDDKKDKKKDSKGGNVRVTQPLSQPGHIASRADYLGNTLGAHPPPSQMTNNKSFTNEYALPQQPQQDPNFNAMYGQDTTSLVDANSPVPAAEWQEPQAANGLLGGSFGGSSF